MRKQVLFSTQGIVENETGYISIADRLRLVYHPSVRDLGKQHFVCRMVFEDDISCKISRNEIFTVF